MYKTANGWTKAKMLEHIRTNFKGKSVIGAHGFSNNCAYRGDEGAKCAVGLFIPDEVYSPIIENWSAAHIVQAYPKLAPYMPLADSDALVQMQKAHDFSEPSQTLGAILDWIETNVED